MGNERETVPCQSQVELVEERAMMLYESLYSFHVTIKDAQAYTCFKANVNLSTASTSTLCLKIFAHINIAQRMLFKKSFLSVVYPIEAAVQTVTGFPQLPPYPSVGGVASASVGGVCTNS